MCHPLPLPLVLTYPNKGVPEAAVLFPKLKLVNLTENEIATWDALQPLERLPELCTLGTRPVCLLPMPLPRFIPFKPWVLPTP